MPDAYDLAQASADVLGGLGSEPFNLDLDRKLVGIGLRKDTRRHEAALGQQLERTRLPIINIVDPITAELQARRITRVALFGTIFTMQGSL